MATSMPIDWRFEHLVKLQRVQPELVKRALEKMVAEIELRHAFLKKKHSNLSGCGIGGSSASRGGCTEKMIIWPAGMQD